MAFSAQSGDATTPFHTGIFGGTFNPIHLGHTNTVEQLAAISNLDQVRYIPSAVPPHRVTPMVSAEHRLKMVQLAIADDPKMIADSRELDRSGPSYTIDTIESVRTEFPQITMHLILGLDAALGLETWHRWQSLLDAVNLTVMVRPGWDLPKQLPAWWAERTANIDQLRQTKAGRISLVPITPVDISSTHVRDGLKAGTSVQQWLHPSVLQYIQQHDLYE